MKILSFTALALFVSCAGNPGKKENNADSATREISGAVTQKIDTAKITVPGEIMERGKTVYDANCLACHQADGSGNPGMYPPLGQTEKVLGDKKELIRIVINGLSGEIEVKGDTYYQAMPPQGFLSDRQIADVLTYVRNSFGNSAPVVEEGEVNEVRSEKDHS